MAAEQPTPGQAPPAAYARWYRASEPDAAAEQVASDWRIEPPADREFWTALQDETASLREQLAQARKERDRYAELTIKRGEGLTAIRGRLPLGRHAAPDECAEMDRIAREALMARVPRCPQCGSPLYDGASCPDCVERERITALFDVWIDILMAEPNSHPPAAWKAAFAALIDPDRKPLFTSQPSQQEEPS